MWLEVGSCSNQRPGWTHSRLRETQSRGRRGVSSEGCTASCAWLVRRFQGGAALSQSLPGLIADAVKKVDLVAPWRHATHRLAPRAFGPRLLSQAQVVQAVLPCPGLDDQDRMAERQAAFWAFGQREARVVKAQLVQRPLQALVC